MLIMVTLVTIAMVLIYTEDSDDGYMTVLNDGDTFNDGQVGMSMMENPNLMDAASFGGPQSPIGEWNNSMIMSHLDRR